VRRTRAQLAEDRAIYLEEIRLLGEPDMAADLADAGYSEVKAAHDALYDEGPIADTQRQLRREAYEYDLAYIRERYHVPAELGRRVRYCPEERPPQEGRITGADCGRLLIRLRGSDSELPYHPTWRIDYLDGQGVRG
jgi:hypothetical protein